MGNLSAFMRSEFKQEEIVEIEGFDRFKDENGKPVKFKVKILSFNKIQEIRKFHRIEKAAYDKNKNPIIADGKLVKEIIFDNEKAAENILVEALVYPNLKDKELMKFYEVEDILDMPYRVFTQAEYTELQKRLAVVLHLATPEEDNVEEVKN